MNNCEVPGCSPCVTVSSDYYAAMEPIGKPDVSPMREFTVEPLDYGFRVRVGCKSIAIESKERLLQLLTQYILDPDTTTKAYWNKTLFSYLVTK